MINRETDKKECDVVGAIPICKFGPAVGAPVAVDIDCDDVPLLAGFAAEDWVRELRLEEGAIRHKGVQQEQSGQGGIWNGRCGQVAQFYPL